MWKMKKNLDSLGLAYDSLRTGIATNYFLFNENTHFLEQGPYLPLSV